MPLTLLAILPSEEISEKVKDWKSFMLQEYGCKVALKSPAHITLIPPFHVSKENTDQLKTFMQPFAEHFKTFSIALHHFSTFPPRVIFVKVVENETLSQVKEDLEEELISAGFPIKTEQRAFHPHITIANRDLQKKDFKPAWEMFSSKTYHADFVADAITILQHDGVQWNIIFRAPFKS